MDKKRIEGGLKKTTGALEVNTGRSIGSRHTERESEAEKTEGRTRSGVGDAMDAVRDVVNNEK